MKKLFFFLFPLMMFSQDTILVGDVDCNGQINSEDASLILQFVTNVIDSLPCEANMTGLTPEQLQEMIDMMDDQLSVNYAGGVGDNYPIMISGISSETVNWGDALIYCSDLEEDGYYDWFLPNLDQLSYAVGGGCELPDERLVDAYLWTTTKSHYGSSSIVVLSEEGWYGLNDTSGSGNNHCRCVRFGGSETGEGSGGSSNSPGSSSSAGGSSEQPITMIGPMYRYDECDENCFSNALFIHPFINYQEANTMEHRLYFADALKFCGQLEHDGYDDWFLPSIKQLTDYISAGNSVSVSNILDCDNDICTWEFWTISGTSNSASLLYNFVNSGHSLVGFGEGWSYNSYKKCLCVR